MKKVSQKRNLAQLPVLIDDQSANSDYFNLSELPDVFTAGKNGFLINGTAFLSPTTPVSIEIIDSKGNAVFSQAIKNYSEGQARVISVEIYEDTPPGPATLTIVGTVRLLKNGQSVPDEWRNITNVRWQKQVVIQPAAINTTKIRLNAQPEISVKEFLVPYRNAIISSDYAVVSGSASLVTAKNASNPDVIPSFILQNSIISGTSPFVSSMVGGNLFVPDLFYTASIIKVINSGALAVDSAISGSDGFTNAPVFIQYLREPTFAGTILTRSFAQINIRDLSTFTGDVARTKIYIRSLDESRNYQPLADIYLDNQKLLTTSSLDTSFETVNFGKISSQDIINKYWQSGIADPINGYGAGNTTASYASNRLIDSMFLSNVYSLKETGSAVPQYYIGTRRPLSFLGDEHEYSFNANIFGVKFFNDSEALAEVYLSGSAFPGSGPLGFKIASYAIPKDSPFAWFDRPITKPRTPTVQVGGNFVSNFFPQREGTAKLIFVVYSGEWYFSDISLDETGQNGFTPNELTTFVGVTGRRFERLQFKAELYDHNHNVVPVDIESIPILFDGGNYVFKGTDHRIEGRVRITTSGSSAGIDLVAGLATISGSSQPGNISGSVSGSWMWIGSGSFPSDPIFMGVKDSGEVFVNIGVGGGIQIVSNESSSTTTIKGTFVAEVSTASYSLTSSFAENIRVPSQLSVVGVSASSGFYGPSNLSLESSLNTLFISRRNTFFILTGSSIGEGHFRPAHSGSRFVLPVGADKYATN